MTLEVIMQNIYGKDIVVGGRYTLWPTRSTKPRPFTDVHVISIVGNYANVTDGRISQKVHVRRLR